MLTPGKRKLVLNKETIRAMSTREMADVVGGWFTISRACPTAACQSDACPHSPPLTSPGYCTNGCTVAVMRM